MEKQQILGKASKNRTFGRDNKGEKIVHQLLGNLFYLLMKYHRIAVFKWTFLSGSWRYISLNVTSIVYIKRFLKNGYFGREKSILLKLKFYANALIMIG